MTNGPNAPRVVLADDHHFSREGLRGMLEEQGIAVVGEATDSSEAVALATSLAPDLVVIDPHIPGDPAKDTIRRIAAAGGGVRVLVLSSAADGEDVLEALAAGAEGYVLKGTPGPALVGAISQAAAGSAVLSPEAMRAVLARMPRRAAAQPAAYGAHLALSRREQEVLELLVAGADNAEIGRELSISRHTVKQHVTNIFGKLDVDGRVQAAVRAVRDGLV